MIHFPIIYVATAGAILFNPIKGFYFRARLYFMTTMVNFNSRFLLCVGPHADYWAVGEVDVIWVLPR